MMKCNGYDPNGIPRVFGYAKTEAEARAQCQTAIIAYIVRRPDTAPYEAWTIGES